MHVQCDIMQPKELSFFFFFPATGASVSTEATVATNDGETCTYGSSQGTGVFTQLTDMGHLPAQMWTVKAEESDVSKKIRTEQKPF